MEKMQDRAISACMKYLESTGFRAVRAYKGHIVAQDDGEVVFVTVAVTDAFGDISGESRSKRENLAFDYLARHEELVEKPVRFDDIQLRVMGGDRALVKHYKNCMRSDVI